MAGGSPLAAPCSRSSRRSPTRIASHHSAWGYLASEMRPAKITDARGPNLVSRASVSSLILCSSSMVDLELTRAPGDRRLYELEGVGSLRLQGFLLRTAIAGADGRSWRLASSGLWGPRIEATDAVGAVAGVFELRSTSPRLGSPLGRSRARASSRQQLAGALRARRRRPRACPARWQGLGSTSGEGHRRRPRRRRRRPPALRGLRCLADWSKTPGPAPAMGLQQLQLAPDEAGTRRRSLLRSLRCRFEACTRRRTAVVQ